MNLEEAKALQEKYSLKIKNQEKNSESLSYKNIRRIAGVDISYFNKENQDWGVSCAVLWDIHENTKRIHTFHVDKIKFPYKAGFLGFRECRLFAHAIAKLKQKPDLILCDGHGIIHPKRFGEAAQLGVALDIPTIGVAKKPFIGDSDWKNMIRKKGEKAPIWTAEQDISEESSQELLGYAICLNNNMKPVFVSIGYKINIDLAIKVVLNSSQNHRQPEPLFLAHKLSKEKLDSLF
ncbi:MAG: endonuclease V [Candidatus Hermodarchaeota archaeon]